MLQAREPDLAVVEAAKVGGDEPGVGGLGPGDEVGPALVGLQRERQVAREDGVAEAPALVLHRLVHVALHQRHREVGGRGGALPHPP